MRRLGPEDELLTPAAWFPQPLTNGNLLLVRTSPKMVLAYRRSPYWRAALRQPTIYVFDEHWGTSGPGMHQVYHDMHLSGQLGARPTRQLLLQDIVFMRETAQRTLPDDCVVRSERPHHVELGQLTALRDGPCVCSAQVDNVDLGGCASA